MSDFEPGYGPFGADGPIKREDYSASVITAAMHDLYDRTASTEDARRFLDRLATLAREWRPTMHPEVMTDWASEIVSLIIDRSPR